jgi:dihydroneopterin aldolase
MFTIQLDNLKFFAFHGIHDEERILGGHYEVNAAVSFNYTGTITSLDQTIDYVKIYDIINQQMTIPVALLETLAQNLANAIYAIDKRIESINISIKKINPPIAKFQGAIAVSYKKDFLT